MLEFLREPNWVHGFFSFCSTIFRFHQMILKVICSNMQTTPMFLNTYLLYNEEFTSSLQDIAKSIVNCSVDDKFQLNPIKCKEIVINFQRNEPVFLQITINGTNIERVEKTTILGLLITQDLKWNAHVDKITTKAAKRLYLLKQLLSDNDLMFLHHLYIRSILEVFHYDLPEYLSDQIERIQTRTLRIICLDLSYSEAIEDLDMEILRTRRKGLCIKVFKP